MGNRSLILGIVYIFVITALLLVILDLYNKIEENTVIIEDIDDNIIYNSDQLNRLIEIEQYRMK